MASKSLGHNTIQIPKMLRRRKPFEGSLGAAVWLRRGSMLSKSGLFGLALAFVVMGAHAQSVPEPRIPPSAAPSAGPSRPNVALPVILGARVGEQPDRTRFVIETSVPLDLRVFTLANPNRVVIELPDVLWRLQAPERPSGTGAVRSYRYGPFRPGDSRFVIDLNHPVQVAEPLILPPDAGFGYRVVLDLFPTSQEKFEASAGWPSDLRAKDLAAERAEVPPPVAELSVPPAAKPTRSRVVVIDAGHGGVDSGTTGVDGLLEKNLVLDEALRLKKILQKQGYLVHLTR